MVKTLKTEIKRRNSLSKSATLPKTAVQPSANIKVVIRVRPPNQRENENKHVVRIVDDNLLIFDPKDKSDAFFYQGVQQKGRDLLKKVNKNMQFFFDRVFGFESTNKDVFTETTSNLIDALMDGYNCSVFAYGATGAGKTHTMLGNQDNPGITYQTMEALFDRMTTLNDQQTFKLGLTYLEVYNELVRDLLNRGPPLQLREDGRYGVTVAGIKMHHIETVDDLFGLLEKGNASRTQHATDANAESSRSHAVFQVYIQMETKLTKQVTTAKLSMIDLAGSERGSATGFVGERFTEGANINKSLLALGNCINSLADGQRHVPYRDSKLTRLLKDSLGGNCQTIMIANISPSTLTYEDTYNTLKYAMRAKAIKSNMKRNIVNMELNAAQYNKVISDMRKELDMLKQQVNEANSKPANKLDTKLLDEAKKLFDDRRKLIDRIHHIEKSEQIVTLRKKLKEEANSRLSGLCVNTPDKEESHKRIDSLLNRCNRQQFSLNTEIQTMKQKKCDLEKKTMEMLKNNPLLEQMVLLENSNLKKIESEHQTDLAQQKLVLFENASRSQGVLLEKIIKMTRTCFLQLRGHGYASENLVKDYNNLVLQLQGLKSLSWTDESNCSDEADENQIENDVFIPPTNADSTFVLPSINDFTSKSIKVCTEEMIAKVYKTTPKKFFKATNTVLPKRLKDNHPLRTVTNSQQTLGAHARIGSRLANNSEKRPPFRT